MRDTLRYLVSYQFILDATDTKWKRILITIGIDLLLLIFGATVLLVKQFTEYSIKCPIYETTNFYCATCGVTRQALAVLHGQIYQAFRYNVMTFVLAIPTVVIYLTETIEFIRHGKFSKHLDKIIFIYIIILIAFALCRNTDWFSWLAPTDVV